MLQLPTSEFELACCGQKLPPSGDVDYFTVNCQPIVLARNMNYVKDSEITNNGEFHINIKDEEGKAFSLRYAGKTPKEVKVKEVREIIAHHMKGIPEDKLYLSYRGVNMENEDFLSYWDNFCAD